MLRSATILPFFPRFSLTRYHILTRTKHTSTPRWPTQTGSHNEKFPFNIFSELSTFYHFHPPRGCGSSREELETQYFPFCCATD